MDSNDLVKNFNKIYDDTYYQVLNHVISKCDNIANIEDIVQDVYSELYEIMKKKDINYIKNYNSFIFDLTKKKIFKYYNLKYKFKNIISNKINSNHDTEFLEEIPDTTNYEDEFLNKYTYDEIYSEILKLNLITQKIMIFYYMQDLEIEKIANILDININTVKSKLYRGLEKLKVNFNYGGEKL